MSRHLNKVQIIGNLGADPEMRYTQDGRPIASLNVATSENWTDKQGQRQERTEWHRVSMFNKLAEIAGQYLRKGSKVFIEGQLKTDKWTDKHGMERFTTKIVLGPYNSQLIMLDSKPGGGGPGMGYGGAPSGQGYAGPQQQMPAYAGPQQQMPAYAGPQQQMPAYAGPQQQTPPAYAGPQGEPTYPGPQQGQSYAGAPQQQEPARQNEQQPASSDAFDQTPEFDDDIPF